MTREQEREALAKLIACLYILKPAPSSTAWEIADRILAAGYRILPPDWPDDEAVERAADAWWERFDGPFLSNKGAHPTYEAAVRNGMRAAILAAVSQGDDDGS